MANDTRQLEAATTESPDPFFERNSDVTEVRQVARSSCELCRWLQRMAARCRAGCRQQLALVRDWLVYLVVRVLICMVQCLHPEMCVRLSEFLGFLCGRVLRIRHGVVDENLRHAFPEHSDLERQRIEQGMWRHLILMVCEVALAQRKIHDSNWRDHVSIRNQRELVRALASPRPLVAVTAHLGNFEMAGYVSGLLGFPTFTIARPLDNPFLQRFLLRFRGATGQFLLPTKGSGEQAQRVIEGGECLALLGDHFGGKKGCWVEFFHRPASCHKAISVFSLANRAPICVMYMRRTGKFLQFEMVAKDIFDPAADDSLGTIPEMTAWYNRLIEAAVRESEDQYWWLHRRWKDPRRKKIRAVRADPPHDAMSPSKRLTNKLPNL